MVLPDYEIEKLGAVHLQVIPWEPENVNPASLDLRLSDEISVPMWYWRPGLRRAAFALHQRWPKRFPLWSEPRKFKRFVLWPGRFVLCSSLEWTAVPDTMIALLFSKSSTGRLGLEHLHAGYGDPGFNGTWTLELINVAPWPVVLEAGKRLMQLAYIEMSGPPARTYRETGRYNGQVGPTPARER
jgi:dCTP deaminase